MGEVGSRAALGLARVEWVAAAFGLLTGLTMVYVPYEFGTSVFHIIYPHIRPLGTSLLVGSAMMFIALVYPSWSAWLGGTGRALFLVTLAFYWWNAAVLAGGVTGVLIYPVMMGGVIAESLPRWRQRGLFALFLTVVAMAFGLSILWNPALLGASFYPIYRPVARPMAVLFLGAGALLGVGLGQPVGTRTRIALGSLALLFGQMSLVAGYTSAWTGMELYLVIGVGCLLMLVVRRSPELTGVGWRLFRGVALASVLPILAVGGLASAVAQQAIEREVRDKTRQAVEAEIAWLEQSVATARLLLLSQARDPLMLDALRARNGAVLDSRLSLLEFQPGPFDAAWVVDGSGRALRLSSHSSAREQADFSSRDYFKHGRTAGDVYLSRPFLNVDGIPMVAFATAVPLGGDEMGVLVGGMSLVRMGRELTFASRNYHVEIFDRREGALLRDTDQGQSVLSRAPVLSMLETLPGFSLAPGSTEGSTAGSTEGSTEGNSQGLVDAADASGRRLLIAHARVPGTPWTVSVTAPLRVAFAAVTRLSAIVVLIALAAGAVALLLSRWVGRSVAQRLTALRDGFAALGTLKLDQPVPARGDDELAQLTEGFNEMAARIERTQKELHEAIASRDQFMSIASHELRTPLTPLKATIELILRQSRPGEGMTPERLRAMLERLRRQVDRLTRLVGDMLDMSRLRTGRFSLRRASMDLSALAREVVDRIEHTRSERSAPIPLELPDEPLVGIWDDQRLDQLLTNLVENAVRYSPPDKPIHVRMRPEQDGVRVEVEDQGIGIPVESLPHLFQPFYRAQNASEHHAGGLGLGLSICREIVERHGGRIEVESPGPGQGTRFRVFLPRGEAVETA